MGNVERYYAAFHLRIANWQSSGLADSESLFQAAQVLHEWLGASPQDAANIQRFALGAAYASSHARRPEETLAMTPIGREASIMRPLASDEDVASAILLAFLEGNARFETGDNKRDTSLFDESRRLSETLSDESPFRRYLDLHRHTMVGRVAASRLERDIASEHLWRATELGHELLHSEPLFRELAHRWQAIVWGEIDELIPDAAKQVANLLRQDVTLTYWRAAAALGFACGDQSVDAARKCLDVCREFGCLEGPAFQLRPAILGIPVEERAEAVEALRAGLPDAALSASWELLFDTSVACGMLRDGDIDRAHAVSQSLNDSLEDCRDVPILAMAVADGLQIDAAKGNSQDASGLLTQEFFAAGVRALNGSPHQLQYKTLFEEHFASAIRLAANDFVANDNESALALSVLLDAIRSPDTIRLPGYREPDSINDGLANAANLLGRLAVALKNWPDMGIIITQRIGDDTLFVTEQSGKGIRIAWAGVDYRNATHELAKQYAEQVTSRRRNTDRLIKRGMAAYSTLPDQVTELVHDCEFLIIVPDLAAEAAGVPYELFHDRNGLLGTTHSMARVQSIRRLVDLLEAPILIPKLRYRSAAVAVPEVEGLPPLKTAKAEALNASKFFQGLGWECPDVDIDNLSAPGLLDALQLADFVHIAAHGELGVGGHSVVLAGGQRLSQDGIAGGNRLLHSGVFLNTCWLGRAEYLGAGVSRGIANVLGSSGAPVVIANLLPVQDDEAERLAQDVYSHLSQHSVGKALALARKAAVERRGPASIWGGAILVGNPAYIVGSGATTMEDDVTAELLSAYVDNDAPAERREAAYLNAVRARATNSNDPRLNAALCWVDQASSLQPPNLDQQDLEDGASLAAALNHPEGEALMRFLSAEYFVGRESLQVAATALTRVASYRDYWQRALTKVLAKLNRMDTPAEVPLTAGGLSVNDMNDPAVAEAWSMIRAQDQGEIERIGAVELRRPETDLHCIAWNAIVLGKHARFDDTLAARAFADHLSEKLIETGHIDASSKLHAQRILATLLYYFWTTQRRHHLDWDRAAWQTAALELAIDRLAKHWNPSSLPAEYSAFESVESAANAWRDSDSDSATDDLRTALTDALALLAGTWKDVAADGAAWLMGLFDELNGQVAVAGTSETDRLPSELYASINKDADRWFQYYKDNGSRAVPFQPNHFLAKWRAQGVG